MTRLTPLWRQRLALLALAIGSLLVGIWADVLLGRKPDYFDLRTAVIAFLLSWIPTEIGRNAINNIQRVKPALARWLLAAVIGIFSVAVAYALPTFLSGLLNVPRVGLSFLPTLLMGLAFTLRQALIPVLVVGSMVGVIGFVVSRESVLP